jgi:hypothetical protein
MESPMLTGLGLLSLAMIIAPARSPTRQTDTTETGANSSEASDVALLPKTRLGGDAIILSFLTAVCAACFGLADLLVRLVTTFSFQDWIMGDGGASRGKCVWRRGGLQRGFARSDLSSRRAMHSSVLTAALDALQRGAFVRRVRGATLIRHSGVVSVACAIAPQTRYRAFPPPWVRVFRFDPRAVRGCLGPVAV